ncbi:MAG: metal-dependent hydrolase [Sinimarinibacterium sp.]|jgi:hypothetical protein
MEKILPFPNKDKASSTEYSIRPRKVRFDWSQTPRDWIPGQPFASAFINEINMILPAGEFWFCRLYNQALPYVTDAKLREDVQAFVRQEAMHARAHGSACAEYLAAQGIDTKRNLALMDWIFEQALADEPFGRKLPKFAHKQWLVFRLGLIAAVEHMTCVLGKYALNNHEWDKAGADPVLLDLIRWHGAEEIEHRSVAFDLYRHLGGTYISRYYLSAMTFVMVFGIWADGTAHLLEQDERYKARKPSAFKPWLWIEWVRVARSGHLPDPLWLFLSELPYLSPWYDPRNEASTEQALAYLDKSPAAKAVAA